MSTEQWPNTRITLSERTRQSAYSTIRRQQLTRSEWILVYGKIPFFWGSSATKKSTKKPRKCTLSRATDVCVLLCFIMSRSQNFRAVFWNCTSRAFNWSINSGPKILRSCLLHCVRSFPPFRGSRKAYASFAPVTTSLMTANDYAFFAHFPDLGLAAGSTSSRSSSQTLAVDWIAYFARFIVDSSPVFLGDGILHTPFPPFPSSHVFSFRLSGSPPQLLAHSSTLWRRWWPLLAMAEVNNKYVCVWIVWLYMSSVRGSVGPKATASTGL